MAVFKALAALSPEQEEVEILSDSSYVVRGCNEYVHNWATSDWKGSKGTEIANADIWKQIYPLLLVHKARLTKVKGHSGEAGNEYVDSLANQVARE